MERILFFVYNGLAIPLLYAFFAVSRWIVPKIREGFQGRKEMWNDLQKVRESLKPDEYVILFHCTSMGEVEQAKPIIEAIKSEYTNAVIVVTFFSPSGYLNYKPSDSVRLVTYLPFDSPWQARKFFDTLDVRLWIIVKHDLWLNHLSAANRRNIPMVLIDANLPPHSKRLWLIVRLFYKTCLNWFSWILPVSKEDAQRFARLYKFPEKLIVTGDTRYDQVIRKSKEIENQELEPLVPLTGKPVFIGGSVWHSDTALLIPALPQILEQFPGLKIVLVPHEPTKDNLEQLENELHRIGLDSVCYSSLKETVDDKVIIVDVIGVLAHVYKYGTICYVGGSCGPGVHNVMEPAILGKPVLFGPKHTNSFEALELVRREGAFPVKNSDEFASRLLLLLKDVHLRNEVGSRSAEVIQEHIGATYRIMEIIKTLLP